MNAAARRRDDRRRHGVHDRRVDVGAACDGFGCHSRRRGPPPPPPPSPSHLRHPSARRTASEEANDWDDARLRRTALRTASTHGRRHGPPHGFAARRAPPTPAGRRPAARPGTRFNRPAAAPPSPPHGVGALSAAGRPSARHGDRRQRIRRHELVGARQSLRPAGGRRRVLLEDRGARASRHTAATSYITPCGVAALRLAHHPRAGAAAHSALLARSQFEIAPGALDLFLQGRQGRPRRTARSSRPRAEGAPPPRARVN